MMYAHAACGSVDPRDGKFGYVVGVCTSMKQELGVKDPAVCCECGE